MSMKYRLKKTAAILLGLALTVGATGCNFTTTDSQADLKQRVASVNISQTLAKDAAYSEYADDIAELIQSGVLSTDIPKRDLIAYFMNLGYNYVQNGYSYSDTIEMLMDGLVQRKILTQYAVAYYLDNGDDLSTDSCMEYVNQKIDGATGVEKTLLKSHPEVLTMKYFLTENETDMEDYDAAVFGFMKSLNKSLDSAESNYITATGTSHTHSESRTTPTGVDTTNEDYIPVKADGSLDYDIYTGRNTLDSCGTYEKVQGSTATTRMKAYNMFLSNLQGYGLIKKNEDTAKIKELDYYYLELTAQLGQALINKYFDALQEEAVENLKGVNEDYQPVADRYDEIVARQQKEYSDLTAFETALGSVSDTSFVLYGQRNFGFVYNILLPFSEAQNLEYSAAKKKLKGDALYEAREEILAEIEAKDLRTAWFCSEVEESTHYAYEVTTGYYDNESAKGDNTYLFFENNMNNSGEDGEYKSLKQYAGTYPYNGKAELKDGEWEFTPNRLSIGTKTQKGFIQEMESYINYVVSGDKNSGVASGNFTNFYGSNYVVNGETNYKNFLYYEGKVNLTNTSRSQYFYKEGNDTYAAVSAVNELMFAYSTDPGCLNTYMGYVVSPYKTSFVSEFEYAAQYAVLKGAGSYVVCATDYGWHIIYVSMVCDAAEIYEGGFIADDVEKEGTFSNLFYEYIKSSTASTYTTDAQNNVMNAYVSSATYYQEAYQDLLDLDKA